MLTRYAVAAVGMVGWAVATTPTWLRDPLAFDARFGASFESLALFVVGFVVLGTLYHVVPFVVWLDRYADRLGYEPVPMIDDLYDERVAKADLGATVAGAGCLVAADAAASSEWVALAGAGLFLLGVLLFSANLVQVVRVHGDGIVTTLVDTTARR